MLSKQQLELTFDDCLLKWKHTNHADAVTVGGQLGRINKNGKSG
jgi:hypothetical protein